MADKYNETNDDFFAKFDEIAEKENDKIAETDTYSADAADAEYSYGSASSYRSGSSNGDVTKKTQRSKTKLIKTSAKAEKTRKKKAALKAEKAAVEAELAAMGEKTAGTEKPADAQVAAMAEKPAKPKKKKKTSSKVEKAKKSASSARARAIAASSKFGGSASGKTDRKPLKKESPLQAFWKTLVAVMLMLVFAVGIYVGFIFVKAPAINTDDIYSQIS